MKKKIFFFLIFFILNIPSDLYSNEIYQSIKPEKSSGKDLNQKLKLGFFKNFTVATANDYSTKIGYNILSKGGSVADAAVAIQLTLGLVEPQSSGLGGGLFLTYYDNKTNEIISIEGREKAPTGLKENVFLKNGKPINFFDAVVGGSSVGVPSTLKSLYLFHKLYGILEWDEVIKPVVELSVDGFIPPKRLLNALKKERFLFSIYPNSIFARVKKNPEKKFINKDYTRTLNDISKDVSIFYRKRIASDIVSIVQKSKNPGKLELEDLINYKPEKNPALCYELKIKFKVCGPNLPTSGTISIVQALILFEYLKEKKKTPDLEDILEILNFVYSIRDNELADPKFVKLDITKLLNKSYLVKNFEQSKNSRNKSFINNFSEITSSTSHFSLIDKYKNVLSLTSSIESSFGSRLYTNGFFLNNQLTDFSFNNIDKFGNKIKNRPQPGKRPLSSMSPIIVFDKNDDFFLTLGSPGGKAIISYVFKCLIAVLYMNESIEKAIEKPNYIKIKGNIFVEDDILNNEISIKGLKRNLTSGIVIIMKNDDGYIAAADSRRDGTVRGN